MKILLGHLRKYSLSRNISSSQTICTKFVVWSFFKSCEIPPKCLELITNCFEGCVDCVHKFITMYVFVELGVFGKFNIIYIRTQRWFNFCDVACDRQCIFDLWMRWEFPQSSNAYENGGNSTRLLISKNLEYLE